MEAHGGSIEVVSGGAGTTVRISLPRVAPPPSDGPSDNASNSSSDNSSGSPPAALPSVTTTGSHAP